MKNFLNIFFISFLISCQYLDKKPKLIIDSLTESNFDLTETLVTNYIAAYKELRAKIPNGLKDINEKGMNIPTDGFNVINDIVQKNGFKDYFEFVRVNAKIAWAFNLASGEIGMSSFQNLKNEGIQSIDEQLNDPNVPNEVKEELKKTKAKILENWENNKKWADVTLSLVRKLTNENDIRIIKKYYKELQEAYVGITLPNPEKY